ncbi:unnamed protein product [Polarella glacialis]|uniref:Phospholipase B-like n=1 Tax=Polarella glacialis TaxID=89957 RepID=A0A813DBS8_POLGL|nr:unnamed protein product [Polarella glacialis]
MIAGRKMDGENDVRKVTVSHFLAHAVTLPGGASFVHFMWPGFVSVASGVNQHGLWVMMNDGSSLSAGPAAQHATPFGWTVRQMLARSRTVAGTRPIVAEFASDQGGTCSGGCNLLVAQADRSASGAQALVLESDRSANSWRAPGEVEPLITRGIMVTNHEFINGYDQRSPLENYGEQVYFSSLWRYEADKNLANAFAEYGPPIGTEEMKRLLQSDARNHGAQHHVPGSTCARRLRPCSDGRPVARRRG